MEKLETRNNRYILYKAIVAWWHSYYKDEYCVLQIGQLTEDGRGSSSRDTNPSVPTLSILIFVCYPVSLGMTQSIASLDLINDRAHFFFSSTFFIFHFHYWLLNNQF